jgi:hypothetical protein
MVQLKLSLFYIKFILFLALIYKSEKELRALDNTLSHLTNRNSKYRDGFLNKVIWL